MSGETFGVEHAAAERERLSDLRDYEQAEITAARIAAAVEAVSATLPARMSLFRWVRWRLWLAVESIRDRCGSRD